MFAMHILPLPIFSLWINLIAFSADVQAMHSPSILQRSSGHGSLGSEGLLVGTIVSGNSFVGASVGAKLGVSVDSLVGDKFGIFVGFLLGTFFGAKVGFDVGESVGFFAQTFFEEHVLHLEGITLSWARVTFSRFRRTLCSPLLTRLRREAFKVAIGFAGALRVYP